MLIICPGDLKTVVTLNSKDDLYLLSINFVSRLVSRKSILNKKEIVKFHILLRLEYHCRLFFKSIFLIDFCNCWYQSMATRLRSYLNEKLS